MNFVEAIAAAFGVICVWWTIRQSILCWPTGLLQVLLYVFVFWKAKLYSDLLLHVVYVLLQIYGWHHWLKGGSNHHALAVTELRGGVLTVVVAGVVIISVGWGGIMGTYTNAVLPHLDAFILVLSLSAQILMALKKVESWYFWIIVDVLALWVYSSRHLYLTTGLYALFLVMAVLGLREWKRSMTRERKASEMVAVAT
ncbi:MAG: aminotransferase [Lentisphaerae bacterium GWF2_57_35]|nr:MAG: aminotransferase [Lentisphaerae bacterium GWF2_57_35]